MNKVLDLELKGDIENCLTAIGRFQNYLIYPFFFFFFKLLDK